MAKTWSDSLVLKFLELYEKNECLWNPKLDEYKFKDARENALESIVADIKIPNLTIIDIKNKIKSIRTTYKRELTSVLKSKQEVDGNGSGKIYEPKLFWYKKADGFLHDVSNAKKYTTQQNIKRECETLQQKPDEQEFEIDNAGSDDSCASSIHISLKRELIHSAPITYESSAKRSRQNIEENSNKDVQITTIARPPDNLASLSSHLINDQEDEFEIFARSIAAQLRRMPLYDAILCQEKVQSVVSQARLSSLNHTSSFPLP